MEDLLIINGSDFDCFTLCKEHEVGAKIASARASIERDKKTYESHLLNYPNMADHWQAQLDKVNKILQSGFRAVTWDEYEKLQRERWLSKDPTEITQEIYDHALNSLPPKCWVRNERYSMFFIGECTTMTYYSQYLYDKTEGKYYTSLSDICDRSTWLDKMLGLS